MAPGRCRGLRAGSEGSPGGGGDVQSPIPHFGQDCAAGLLRFTTNQKAWQFYFGRLSNAALGNTVRFAYESITGTSGVAGNYIDAADFGVNAGFTPVPGPLPVMGAAAAFDFSRRLRRRTLRANRS